MLLEGAFLNISSTSKNNDQLNLYSFIHEKSISPMWLLERHPSLENQLNCTYKKDKIIVR